MLERHLNDKWQVFDEELTLQLEKRTERNLFEKFLNPTVLHIITVLYVR